MHDIVVLWKTTRTNRQSTSISNSAKFIQQIDLTHLLVSHKIHFGPRHNWALELKIWTKQTRVTGMVYSRWKLFFFTKFMFFLFIVAQLRLEQSFQISMSEACNTHKHRVHSYFSIKDHNDTKIPKTQISASCHMQNITLKYS